MNDLQFQNSLLLAQFRKFYREIARLKQTVQIPEHPSEADAAVRDESGHNGRGVWNELRSLLEAQALEAGRSGGAFAHEVYREAQYVMAALADEVFLHLNWDGRASWPLLESALFQTHAAGEILFQRLELLLRQRDPVYVDLAAVYFMALSLGFQGKFRGEQDHERLDLYRRQLFAMIFGQKPQSFESGRPLFPQSQMYTLAGGDPKQLPNPRIWLWVVAAVVVVWLGVSHYLWRSLSDDVNCMIRQVSNPSDANRRGLQRGGGAMSSATTAWLASVWPYIAFCLLLLVLIVVVALWIVLRHARVHTSLDLRAPDREDPEQSKKTASYVTGRLWLRRSFLDGLNLLRASVAGRDHRYQIPWFLLAGASGSGKTAVINNVGAQRSFGVSGHEREVHQSLEWRFFDRGILAAAPGAHFLRNDALTSDEAGWRQLLDLLLRHRPRRPLDGIVVVIPASDLIGPQALDAARLSLRASQFHGKLAEAVKTLGITFPVYILVTKCDLIHGFRSFCGALPETSRDDIFGWSNPYHVDTAFSAEWVGQAFREVSANLLRLQSEIFVHRNEIRERDELFLFPEELARLREPLGVCVDQVFRETAYRESVRFRGLYFCGDAAELGPADTPAEQAEQDGWDGENSTPTPEPAVSRPIFLRRLFERKIFAESALAQPLSRAFLSRNRTIIAAQAAAVALALILGVGTWRADRRLVREQKPVLALLKITLAKEQTKEGVDAHRHDLIPALAETGNVHYKSVFLPSSMILSSTDADITDVMVLALQNYVFESFRDHLKERAEQIWADPPPAPAAQEQEQPVLSIENTPEFQDLDRFAKEVKLLSDNIRIYDDLRKRGTGAIEDMRELMKYLFDIELPPVEERDHFTLALERAQGGPYAPENDEQAKATKRLMDLSERFYDAWFTHSALLDDVADIEQRSSHLGDNASFRYEDLKDLAQSIGDLQALLENRTLAVLSSATVEFSSPLRRVIQEPAQKYPFFENNIVERIRDFGAAKMATLRADLAGRRTSVTGPIVEIDETSKVQITAGTRDLQMALENLLNLQFMTLEPTESFRDRLEPGTRLIWRTEPLQEAQRLLEVYTRFVDEELGTYPLALRTTFARIARDRLSHNVRDLIFQAQEFQPQPAAQGTLASDEAFLPELNGFREAVAPLTDVAGKFNGLGYSDSGKKLISLLNIQAVNLLARLDRALAGEDSYAVRDGNFLWWSGGAPLSLSAYESKSGDELSEFLASERDGIQTLARDAEPILQYLDTWMPQRADPTDRMIRKWRRILDDLNKYQGKKPGTLAGLEEFILAGMDKIRPESGCPSGPSRETAAQGQDFFLQKQINLRRAILQRCDILATRDARQSYNGIAALFNRTLAPYFPFQPDAGEEADLSTVAEFYVLMDQSGKAARDALQHTPNLGAAREEALHFLDQMEQARAAIAPPAADLANEKSPLIDFVPIFRVNQGAEIGGNELTEWTMQVGADSFHYREPAHPAHWRYGTPISLSLRWAKDSPAVPALVSSPSFRTSDRAAVFEITGSWALLRLRRQHEAAQADFLPQSDAKRSVLKFALRMQPDKTWMRAGEALPPSELKIFVQLLAPDGKRPLALPALPATAPELPAAAATEDRP